MEVALWRRKPTAQLPSWSKKEKAPASRPRLQLPQVKASADGPGLLFILVALVVVAVAGARFFGFRPDLPDGGQVAREQQVRGLEQQEEFPVPAAAPGPSSPGRVLIYHAHGSENYHPKPPHSRGGRPGDVVQVGAALAAALREEGFQVEHLTEVFDHPEWGQSFARSGEAVARALERYDDVVAVIDIHRDAIPGDGPASVTTATIGNQPVAKILLVVGEADNPYAQRNTAFAEALKTQLDAVVPQLNRGIRLHTNNYNGHLHPRSVQLFIGDYQRNTLEEAERSARLFSKVLAAVLKQEG